LRWTSFVHFNSVEYGDPTGGLLLLDRGE